ncbi:MAG: hypothetical protein ACREAR_06765 [Nitrosotalea sp.]
MPKETPPIDWDKMLVEYNKTLKAWMLVFETFQEITMSAQTMCNNLMAKALKELSTYPKSQFAKNLQKSRNELRPNKSKQFGDTDNSVTASKKVIIKTPGQAIIDLITLGNNYVVNTRILEDVSKMLNDSNPDNDKTACGKLSMFINQINQNHNLVSSQKITLIESAKAIKTDIGCRV